MKNLTVFLIVLLAALWVSCEKVLDPSDFEDEFGDYRPELKIEGLLQQDKPEDSIVRVDKTMIKPSRLPIRLYMTASMMTGTVRLMKKTKSCRLFMIPRRLLK
ncbi:MAG: hypothetical protein JRJ20_18570 [Deltaproteobacteria bacterium]|nr:hypothetical protein [Deltaproteobacteria bacterium]